MISIKKMLQMFGFLTIFITFNTSLLGMELSDPDAKEQNHQNITQLLCTLCWFEKTERVEQLILDGAPINDFYMDRTPLMYALEFCNTTLLKMLLKHNANPNLPNKYNIYPLDKLFSSRRCSEAEKLEALKLLLNNRLILNNRTEAIQKALNSGLTRITEFLITAPAFQA